MIYRTINKQKLNSSKIIKLIGEKKTSQENLTQSEL